MKREIKFRAWYIDDWAYFTIGQIWSDVIKAVYDKLCIDGSHFYEYTGLKDKNGVEIYEGDILKRREHKVYAINKPRQHEIVVWRGSGWKRDTYNGTINVFPDLGIREMEVIGNIYENPELL